ncbi:hypothetical protein SDC9_204088 [bioreactor metagenome]|uniref:Uncharacterized protein n=1 Tax=bioreactor metagenome TaxID=1076179 RepID=A0A645IZR4_9ZZZZ
MVENKISAITLLCFTASRAVEFNSTILDNPFSGDYVFTVSTPAGKIFTVENHDITIFISLKLRQVNLWPVNN